MAYGFYPFLGTGVFFVGLIVAIILFIVKRKWAPILHLISICLYAFTIGFIIDVFELSKNWILLLLVISTLLMIGLGIYFSKRS